MEKYVGMAVSQGIAVGKIFCYRKPSPEIVKRKAADPEKEERRFGEALLKARQQYVALYEEALQKAGKDQAEIFKVYGMLLQDDIFLGAVESLLREGWNAEYAVNTAGKELCRKMAELQDDYMKERAADLADVSGKVLQLLSGEADSVPELTGPSIVVAEELTPSETMRLDSRYILAFVTAKGSVNSHAAILSRSMGLPALTGVALPADMELDGKMAAVDGFKGELFVEPEPDILTQMAEARQRWMEEKEGLKELKGMDNCTKSGKRIDIYANIGRVEEVYDALAEDAGGIGLLRSEFLYLGKSALPTEEEQFQSYRAVMGEMRGRKVIIRTLDIGADKKVDYLPMEAEDNPAMGYRGIRICLDRPKLLITQLRAIYRAAVYGKAAVMFPMIVSVSEVRAVKEIARQVRDDLLAENMTIGEVELGIMVETPAAALLSDQLAAEVDFFSIGTNDLMQYTLAADRQNPKLKDICSDCHPAVMRLIAMTVQNGHKAGIRVGICGELAGDTSLTGTFLDMGVDELSVSPAKVLSVRRAVRDIS